MTNTKTSKRRFTWDAWDYDCDGEAYIIAKSECPARENIPKYICENDELTYEDRREAILNDIKEGWCKYQVRSDWYNADGAQGGYYVIEGKEPKNKRGYFEVWIIRKGEWY